MLPALAAAVLLSGCGAAYYGAAIGIFITQEDTKTVDTSFPDGVPTHPRNPGFATLQLSAADVTLDRNGSGGFLVPGNDDNPTPITTLEVLGVDFPPGYGELQSNRDAGQDLLNGDRLVIRVNDDVSQEIVFGSADVATVGTEVAATLQAKIRALTPSTGSTIPLEAYTLFTVRYDENTGGYTFTSGAPAESSEVVFEPNPRSGNDATLDASSAATAARLGLTIPDGAISFTGADAVRVTVLNRGTDSIGGGTQLQLYLSHDKLLDPATDILFDRVSIPASIAVGEARTIARRNGNQLPQRLLDSDFTSGKYYILWSLDVSGGETITSNNLRSSNQTIEIYRQVPANRNTLDFAPVRTQSPIAVVASNIYATALTLTNLGAPVPSGGVAIDLELTLSSDQVFDAPAHFSDPSKALAGVRINPTDPNKPITVVVDGNGSDPLTVSVDALGTTVTASYSSGGVATVTSLIEKLNEQAGGVLDAFADGNGDPDTDLLSALLTQAGTSQQIAKDLYVADRSVIFAQTSQPLVQQTFSLSGQVRNTIQLQLLPAKLFSFFRIRPDETNATFADPNLPENDTNNVREGSNHVRVYNPTTATFDPTTGILLPSLNSDDFLSLDAVISRPVNAGSIRQGQQRVFGFQIPDTGLTVNESQLLIILDTDNFDAHIDLLSGSGEFITGSDDGGLGLSPLIYTSAVAGGSNRTFYLVVSSARFDESDISGGGETFNLTISVNPRETTDTALVEAAPSLNLVGSTNKRYGTNDPPVDNKVLIPFSLKSGKAEAMFVLPRRARVLIRSTPVFQIGVSTEITAFVGGAVPSPVEFQPSLSSTATSIVYKPSGGTIDTYHILEKGAYTVAFDGVSSQVDTQKLRLEVDAEFIPPANGTDP